MKYNRGMAVGTYDLFHIGHLNSLKKAYELCNSLIVGVDSDERVFQYKHKYPIIPEDQRIAIVSAIKYVDLVIKMNRVMDLIDGVNRELM